MGKRLLSILLWAGMVSFAATAQAGKEFWLGEPAPDFQLKSLDNEPVSLEQLRQRGYVLLVFWSTQCPVCHAMLPEFKAVARQYDGEGMTLAAVNVGLEDRNSVEAYALQHDVDYLVLNEDDKKAELATKYGLIGTPTIQLVAPDGTTVYRGHHLPPDLAHYLEGERAAANHAP